MMEWDFQEIISQQIFAHRIRARVWFRSTRHLVKIERIYFRRRPPRQIHQLPSAAVDSMIMYNKGVQ